RLVHGLEQARLRLRRGAVDLVREHDVGEERPRLEDELALGRLPDADPDHVGRQHVGGELDALEARADGAGERGGERGLAHPGHVLDENVAAGEEAHDGQPHRFRLAHEGAAHVCFEPADEVERVGHRFPTYHGGFAGQASDGPRARRVENAMRRRSRHGKSHSCTARIVVDRSRRLPVEMARPPRGGATLTCRTHPPPDATRASPSAWPWTPFPRPWPPRRKTSFSASSAAAWLPPRTTFGGPPPARPNAWADRPRARSSALPPAWAPRMPCSPTGPSPTASTSTTRARTRSCTRARWP